MDDDIGAEIRELQIMVRRNKASRRETAITDEHIHRISADIIRRHGDVVRPLVTQARRLGVGAGGRLPDEVPHAITQREYARRLGVDAKQVHTAVRTGVLHAPAVVNRKREIRQREADEMLAASTRHPPNKMIEAARRAVASRAKPAEVPAPQFEDVDSAEFTAEQEAEVKAATDLAASEKRAQWDAAAADQLARRLATGGMPRPPSDGDLIEINAMIRDRVEEIEAEREQAAAPGVDSDPSQQKPNGGTDPQQPAEPERPQPAELPPGTWEAPMQPDAPQPAEDRRAPREPLVPRHKSGETIMERMAARREPEPPSHLDLGRAPIIDTSAMFDDTKMDAVTAKRFFIARGDEVSEQRGLWKVNRKMLSEQEFIKEAVDVKARDERLRNARNSPRGRALGV